MTAIYAGSFDPITNGHLWMIEKGAELFNDLIVAIADNSEKDYMFTLDERLDMLSDSINHLLNVGLYTCGNVFLVDYAADVGADYILRGIRNTQDYGYEQMMRNQNEDFNPNITTIFLIPPRELADISSSFVKGLVGPDTWEEKIKDMVPQPAYDKFIEKMQES